MAHRPRFGLLLVVLASAIGVDKLLLMSHRCGQVSTRKDAQRVPQNAKRKTLKTAVSPWLCCCLAVSFFLIWFLHVAFSRRS